jgi:hypothetical protein
MTAFACGAGREAAGSSLAEDDELVHDFAGDVFEVAAGLAGVSVHMENNEQGTILGALV